MKTTTIGQTTFSFLKVIERKQGKKLGRKEGKKEMVEKGKSSRINE